MPKMKTNSAARKRFKKTGTGKIKRSRAYRRHHAWAKQNKQKRRLSTPAVCAKADEAKIKELIG